MRNVIDDVLTSEIQKTGIDLKIYEHTEFSIKSMIEDELENVQIKGIIILSEKLPPSKPLQIYEYCIKSFTETLCDYECELKNISEEEWFHGSC